MKFANILIVVNWLNLGFIKDGYLGASEQISPKSFHTHPKIPFTSRDLSWNSDLFFSSAHTNSPLKQTWLSRRSYDKPNAYTI